LGHLTNDINEPECQKTGIREEIYAC
jgi:hypothetical protein